jgi:hypothetical protein
MIQDLRTGRWRSFPSGGIKQRREDGISTVAGRGRKVFEEICGDLERRLVL